MERIKTIPGLLEKQDYYFVSEFYINNLYILIYLYAFFFC